MTIKAKYFERKLNINDLDGVDIREAININKIDCDGAINLKSFEEKFSEYQAKDVKQRERAKTDIDFSMLIYKAIAKSDLEERFYYDMRFWQWLCLNDLQEYILWRWDINNENPKRTQYRRFIGAGGVSGFSYNSIARLFIPANILLKERDGKSLLKKFWENQQAELQISQCADVLNNKVFVAATRSVVDELKAGGDVTDRIKQKIVKLNALKKSSFLDTLEEAQIIDLMQVAGT